MGIFSFAGDKTIVISRDADLEPREPPKHFARNWIRSRSAKKSTDQALKEVKMFHFYTHCFWPGARAARGEGCLEQEKERL